MSIVVDTKGTKCPLRCGQCCDYWKDVDQLVKEVGGVGPASERPAACLFYFCGTAADLMADRITRECALRRKERGDD